MDGIDYKGRNKNLFFSCPAYAGYASFISRASVQALTFFPQSPSTGTISVFPSLISTQEGFSAFSVMIRASTPAFFSSLPKPQPAFQLKIVPVRGDFDVRTTPKAIGERPESGPEVNMRGFIGLRGSNLGSASSESSFTPSPLPPRYLWINFSSVLMTLTD